ncbi:hypothetical protein EGM88_03120 [Aureibaculum marinum]|uniref:Prenyltransferase n=1 Tax=Aureibaculum marinum TaxID=2487930 RepID=A0A3N4NT33_9FLAO|nr:hypothetical protein EGM88_03120 [Aureibaculum marinum]
MPTLKKIIDFYIFSNIHVGLAVFCLVKITLLSYGNNSNLIAFFCLFSTITSYNLIRIFRVEEVQPWFFRFIKNNKLLIILLTIFSCIVCFFLIFSFTLNTILWLLPFALITLFYVNPFSFKNKNFSLRYIALIKLFLIAISWAVVTVIIPLVQHSINLGFNEIVITVQRFLFVVSITIPFDIRDMSYDTKNLKTLPQTIGISKSKVFGLVFLMLFLGLEFIKTPIYTEQLQIHFFISVLALFFLLKSTENQNEYYSAFFVESLPIIWLGLFLWLL